MYFELEHNGIGSPGNNLNDRRGVGSEIIEMPIRRVFTFEESNPVPFVNVIPDFLVIPINPPDPFAMAMEMGPSLVSIGVMASLYANFHLEPLFIPTYLMNWYMDDDENSKTGKQLFASYISNIYPYYEYLYNEFQLTLGRVGLHVWMVVYEELYSSYQYLLQYARNILFTLCRYKEFYHIESSLNDPTGPVPIKTCTFNFKNTNIKIENPGEQFGNYNQNIFDPQRFETYLNHLDDVYIYDGNYSDESIQLEHGLPYYNVVFDTLIVVQDENGVRSIEFGNVSRFNKEVNNLILTYSNIAKPSNANAYDIENVVVRKYLFKGELALGRFYQAFSWFFLQPIISHWLWHQMKIDTTQSFDDSDFYLFPSPINTVEKWDTFSRYYINTYKYGSFFSGMTTLYLKMWEDLFGIFK